MSGSLDVGSLHLLEGVFSSQPAFSQPSPVAYRIHSCIPYTYRTQWSDVPGRSAPWATHNHVSQCHQTTGYGM
eukprot:scaffold124721_cov66-Phaeocystis_antarctica.AAC.8